MSSYASIALTIQEIPLQLSLAAPNVCPRIAHNLPYALNHLHLHTIKWSGGVFLSTRNNEPIKIQLTRYISSGRLYDAYRGIILGSPNYNDDITSSIVIKICCPALTYGRGREPHYEPYDAEEHDEFSGNAISDEMGYDMASAKKAIDTEIELLNGPLRTLQGTVTPVLIGMWTADLGAGTYHVLVMEDCGKEYVA